MTPAECVAVFVAAIESQDAEKAKFACTRDGWESTGSASPAKVFQQCVAAHVVPRPDGDPEGTPPRITVAAQITAADGKVMARCWYLLEERLSNHRIAGVTTHPVMRRMYAEGTLPASIAWETLPPSEPAVAWGTAFAEAIRSGGSVDGPEAQALLPLLVSVYRAFPETRIEIAGSAMLDGTPRHAVGLRFVSEGHAPRERWVSLDDRAGSLVPNRVLPGLLPQTMLDGLPS